MSQDDIGVPAPNQANTNDETQLDPSKFPGSFPVPVPYLVTLRYERKIFTIEETELDHEVHATCGTEAVEIAKQQFAGDEIDWQKLEDDGHEWLTTTREGYASPQTELVELGQWLPDVKSALKNAGVER